MLLFTRLFHSYNLWLHSRAWCNFAAITRGSSSTSGNNLLYFTFHKSQTKSWAPGTNDRATRNYLIAINAGNL